MFFIYLFFVWHMLSWVLLLSVHWLVFLGQFQKASGSLWPVVLLCRWLDFMFFNPPSTLRTLSGTSMKLGRVLDIYRVRTVMKNLEKSWNFKTAFSRPGKVLEKWINPESFGKVMEIYFTNLCIIQLCLFGSWISVRDCAWAISHISTLSRSFRI